MANNWLNENQSQIDYYLNSKDIILVDRKRQLKIMTDLFTYYLGQKDHLRFLDIGCGDGILTKIMLNVCKDKECRFDLLDGSETMLGRAKENLGTKNTNFTLSSFEDFMNQNQAEHEYDFIYSSMAIHHLEHHKKQTLYSKIYTLLKFQGVFINIDVVLPVSRITEEFQFQMWLD